MAYISSAGLRVILMSVKTLNTQKGQLALANLSEGVLEIIKMAGFHNLIKIYDTVEEAIKSAPKG